MKKNINFLMISAIFAIFCSNITLAIQDSSKIEEAYETGLVKDTVCFSYKFFPKDTLFYRIESKDSVVVDYGTPLIRLRYERLRVICDSVSAGGLFYLRLTTSDYLAEERSGTEPPVKRDYSPWLGRVTYLTIDSTGKRYSGRTTDIQKAALSPGGSWAPFLFFGFTAQCKAVNESWLVSTTDTLFENGNPPASLKHSDLLRAMEDLDTLGYKSSQFRFIRTGTGNALLVTKEDKLMTNVTVNSGGRIIISKELQVPIYLFQTIEQKINVLMPEQDKIPVTHFTNANFELEEIRRLAIQP